ENVAEDVADVGETRAAAARAAFERRVAVAVVDSALLRIAEDFVGFLRLLEVRLAFLVVRIPIRIVLHRQATEGLLQVFLGCGALDTEHLVITTLAHSSLLRFFLRCADPARTKAPPLRHKGHMTVWARKRRAQWPQHRSTAKIVPSSRGPGHGPAGRLH